MNTNQNNLRKNVRSTWLRRIIILLVLIAVIVGLWRIFTPEKAVSVFKARQVTRQNLSETLSLSGTVAPSKVQEVEYKNIAVQSLLVKAGDRVKKGDRLLVYDLDGLKADLNELVSSRDQAKSTLESSQAEAASLAAGLQGGMMPFDITSQLQGMAGDLTIGFSELAGGLISIGNPFQQLVNQFGQIEFEDLDRLMELLESLNERGEDLLEILNDPELQENLRLALEDLKERLSDLESILEDLRENLPEIPEEFEPTLPTEPTQPDENEETEPEANLFLTEKMQVGLAGGGMDMEQEELMVLMEQFQGIPGGSDLMSAYQQGDDLLAMLDKQIADQELLIEIASEHESAEFDALIAEVQRDIDDIDVNRPLMVPYDESKPIVHSRVNRKDALLLAEGQSLNYTTDDLSLSGEVIFKSPIATNSPVNSTGQSGELFSDFLGGSAQSALMSTEPRVDLELSLEGPDLNQIIFGFDISFEVDLQKEDQTLAIPAESLLAERGENFVYLLKENNILELRQIELGIITREFAEIKSGLEEEDWVILSPPASIKEGVRYNVERQGE